MERLSSLGHLARFPHSASLHALFKFCAENVIPYTLGFQDLKSAYEKRNERSFRSGLKYAACSARAILLCKEPTLYATSFSPNNFGLNSMYEPRFPMALYFVHGDSQDSMVLDYLSRCKRFTFRTFQLFFELSYVHSGVARTL